MLTVLSCKRNDLTLTVICILRRSDSALQFFDVSNECQHLYHKCTDKWIRQASGLEKASASSLLMYLEDLRLEVGEVLQDERGISERRFLWCL